MANSRLEKIGTIYTRTKGLIESGALQWVDRPLWYDLYEAFPPKEEPRYDRPANKKPLRTIFYKDDKIRALFHANNKRVGTVNLLNERTKSITQQFIDIYIKIDEHYEGKGTEEQLYKESINMLNKERDAKKEEDEFVSLSLAFKEAQNDTNYADVKTILE